MMSRGLIMMGNPCIKGEDLQIKMATSVDGHNIGCQVTIFNFIVVSITKWKVMLLFDFKSISSFTITMSKHA